MKDRYIKARAMWAAPGSVDGLRAAETPQAALGSLIEEHLDRRRRLLARLEDKLRALQPGSLN